MQAATFFKRVVSVSTGLCSPAVQLVLPSTAVISSRSAFQPGCCVCSHKSLWQSMSHVEQQEQHQHTTPPGVNPFILPYTPAPYSASPAASTGQQQGSCGMWTASRQCCSNNDTTHGMCCCR